MMVTISGSKNKENTKNFEILYPKSTPRAIIA
jgi:hypothetical protein